MPYHTLELVSLLLVAARTIWNQDKFGSSRASTVRFAMFKAVIDVFDVHDIKNRIRHFSAICLFYDFVCGRMSFFAGITQRFPHFLDIFQDYFGLVLFFA
ncbi:hypothetical protein FB192DRAFT_1395826, partial [Mucor lusitanicus]